MQKLLLDVEYEWHYIPLEGQSFLEEILNYMCFGGIVLEFIELMHP